MAPTGRRVIKAYACAYPDPIELECGARVAVERRDSEWPGWLWCTRPDGVAGWVPEGWVGVDGATGTMQRAYTARELTVAVGDVIEVIAVESGWGWCRMADGEGWVPLDCLEDLP